LLNRKGDTKLGYQVYRKSTHTEIYLHAKSHHHISDKQGVIQTIATRAIRISDVDHLNQELDHLREVFLKNGYHDRQIKKATHKAKNKTNTHTHTHTHTHTKTYGLSNNLITIHQRDHK